MQKSGQNAGVSEPRGLLAELVKDFDATHLISRFVELPSLIYQGPKIETFRGSREFHVSNEFDWLKAPPDFTKTDTLIGFGTNSVWDLAIRKQAERMVIADWDIGPLLTQEYLMRPLITEARTPAEFLSFLSGVPLPTSISIDSADEAFLVIFAYLKSHAAAIEGSAFDQERMDFVNAVLARLQRNPKISEDQLRAVASYYKDMATKNDDLPLDRYGPSLGTNFPDQRKKLALSDGESLAYIFFQARYFTLMHTRRGDDVSSSLAWNASIFSSAEAFKQLKHLFDGNVFYARTAFDDPNFYRMMQTKFEAFSPHGFALSLTNIIDCMAKQPCDQINKLESLLSMSRDYLSSLQAPLTVFRTQSRSVPHRYYRYQVDPHTMLREEIIKSEQ